MVHAASRQARSSAVKAAHLGIQPDRISALEGRRQTVGSEIYPAAQEFLDDMVNYLRVDQRAVGSDPHHYIRLESQGSLVKTIQHIVQAAA